MDNNPQNSPQPQFNPPEPPLQQPVITPEPVMPTEPVPAAPLEPVKPPTFPAEPAPAQLPKKSKKKLTIILIIIAILLIGGGVAAFVFLMPNKTIPGESNTTSDLDVVQNSASSSSQTNVLESQISFVVDFTKKPEIYKRVFMTFDFAKFKVKELGNSTSLSNGEDYFIVFSQDSDQRQEAPLNEMNDTQLELLANTVDNVNYLGHINKFVIESSKEVVINGIKTLRFTGITTSINRFSKVATPAYTVGYNLYIEGYPIQFVGMIDNSKKLDDQALKDALTKDVDDIMKTIRIGGK